MNESDGNETLSSEIVEARVEWSLTELCEVCRVSSERITQFVDEGLIEPAGREPGEWRFSSVSVRRIVVAERLTSDLRVNAAGAALVLDLLEEVEQLRERLIRLESMEQL